MKPEILTIGVYGWEEDTWKSAILQAQPDVFVDIRARRGVRGSQYAFVNSQRLQTWLDEVGIPYEHWKDLAPSPETRAQQHAQDTRSGIGKRARSQLSEEFQEAYQEEVRSSLRERERDGASFQRPLFFCVERGADACHRSLVAQHFSRTTERSVTDL